MNTKRSKSLSDVNRTASPLKSNTGREHIIIHTTNGNNEYNKRNRVIIKRLQEHGHCSTQHECAVYDFSFFYFSNVRVKNTLHLHNYNNI